MSSRVFKYDQINLGMPFKVLNPVCYETDNMAKKILDECWEDEDIDYMASKESMYSETLENASEQAAKIIKDAKLQAEIIIEEALKEGQQQINQLKKDAQKAGYNKGISEERNKYEALLLQVQHRKEATREECEEAIQFMEPEIIKIILEVSKKIMGYELETNKQTILKLIRQGIEKCINKDNVILSVSPEDYEVVKKNKNVLHAMVPGMGDLEIILDQNLSPASCIIDTPYGSIDLGMDTRLAKIADEFKKMALNEVGKSDKLESDI